MKFLFAFFFLVPRKMGLPLGSWSAGLSLDKDLLQGLHLGLQMAYLLPGVWIGVAPTGSLGRLLLGP